MKGMANIIYSVGLIVMLFISLQYITPAISGPAQEPVERKLDSMVYTLRDSLEIAKIYIDTSARYSLYQAAYENGLNGTSDDVSRSVLHDGKRYALWYDDGDTSPDRAEVTKALNLKTNEKFREYMKGYSIDAIFLVKLPPYDKASVTFSDEGYHTFVEISGNESLMISRKTTYDEEITITKNSDVSLIENMPYLRLFEEAKEYHNEIKQSLAGCDEGVLEVGNESFCCTITSEVVENDGKCMVKIEAVTRKRFLVWNGEDVAFEPIKIVFMDRADISEEETEQEETPTEG